MVQVYHYCIVFYFLNDSLQPFAFRPFHDKHSPNLNFRGEFFFWDRDNHPLVSLAVSVFHIYLYRLFLIQAHCFYSVLKSRNNLAFADTEFERLSSFRRVKYGSIIKRPSVMNFFFGSWFHEITCRAESFMQYIILLVRKNCLYFCRLFM